MTSEYEDQFLDYPFDMDSNEIDQEIADTLELLTIATYNNQRMKLSLEKLNDF